MATRYTDLDISANGARDFVIRQRKPTIVQVVAIVLISLTVAGVLTIVVDNKLALLGALLLLLFSVSWYISMVMQRNNDLLLATEFQNALFASALGVNNKFCMIIRKDGNIIYLDRSFQDMFPEFLKQTSRSLDVLLEYGKVSREDNEKIFTAIQRGVYEKVVFNVRTPNNSFQKIIMSIEPILRPSGFIMLRGREFVEMRSGDFGQLAKPEDQLNKSTITLFSHVMDSMNMGVYMTSPSGHIVYTNSVLDQWLDLSDAEMNSNLSLHDIVYPNGQKTDAFEPADYEGEVMLRKKSGSLMKCFINQKVIRDTQNKVIGCTALVHPFAEKAQTAAQSWNPMSAQDVKKKLW